MPLPRYYDPLCSLFPYLCWRNLVNTINLRSLHWRSPPLNNFFPIYAKRFVCRFFFNINSSFLRHGSYSMNVPYMFIKKPFVRRRWRRKLHLVGYLIRLFQSYRSHLFQNETIGKVVHMKIFIFLFRSDNLFNGMYGSGPICTLEYQGFSVRVSFP